MEKLWVLEPNVAVQYSRPYFSLSKRKKNSGLATRDKNCMFYYVTWQVY